MIEKIVNKKNLILGSTGLVGRNLSDKLERLGCKNVLRGTSQNDLTNQMATYKYFSRMCKGKKIDNVFLCAAKVGGIYANETYPVDFIMKNIQIQSNVIDCCYKFEVDKLIFLGSSCIYPKHSQQPIKEEYLLTGPLESTNRPYAIAKIAGIEMCKSYNKQYGTNYIAAMPTNLFGEHDNFDLQTSHVIPALIRKFHEAKENNTTVTLWGDGTPYREFLHVDDLTDALIFLAENYNASKDDCIINIGWGEDINIKAVADIVAKVVGYYDRIYWNNDMPNGTPKKLLDVSKINNLGWKAKITLFEGLKRTYDWYIKNR